MTILRRGRTALMMTVASFLVVGLCCFAAVARADVVGVGRTLFAPSWGQQLQYQLWQSPSTANGASTPCYASHVPGTYYSGPSYPFNSGSTFLCSTNIDGVTITEGPSPNMSCHIGASNVVQGGRAIKVLQAFMLGVDAVTGHYCVNAEANSFGGNLPVALNISFDCGPCAPERVDTSTAQLNSSAVFWNFGQYMNGVVFDVVAASTRQPRCVGASVFGGVSHFTELECHEPVIAYNITVNGHAQVPPCVVTISKPVPHSIAMAVGIKGDANSNTSAICANAAFAQIGDAAISFGQGCSVCHSDDVQH